ncbi:MAG: hypothetical protein MR291_00190 [Oscillospiraceae bacterium]|nr:hypothetical protein [Oscillospiraceae bacterium]
MNRKSIISLSLALTLMMSGCGNKGAPDRHNSRVTTEAPLPADTPHTVSDFSGKYSLPLVDDAATDPLEAARRYVESYAELPYVSNLEVKDAFFADELTQNYLKYWVLAEDSEIRKDYGWTDDMAERGIFKVVHVDYYANYDHTQTSFDMEGDCFINIYMVQYEDTGLWQEITHDYRPVVRNDTVEVQQHG